MHRPAPFSRCALALLLVLAASPAARAAAADEPSPARAAALDNLLLHDCGSCHGLTLKGGLGPPLLAERMAGVSDEELIAVILQGRPGTPMPPWGGELSHADAAWLVRRMREGTEP